MPTRTLGQLIEDTRGERKKREVARALGVHRNTVANWIAGTRSPSTAHLEGLAQLLGWTDADRSEALRLAGSGTARAAA
jgi:transcriptional regulator with XRE-family HTH domain